jgi:hypothetical protein
MVLTINTIRMVIIILIQLCFLIVSPALSRARPACSARQVCVCKYDLLNRAARQSLNNQLERNHPGFEQSGWLRRTAATSPMALKHSTYLLQNQNKDNLVPRDMFRARYLHR